MKSSAFGISTRSVSTLNAEPKEEIRTGHANVRIHTSSRQKTSPEKTLEGPGVRRLCREEFPSIEVAPNVFTTYLSNCVRDPESTIYTEGRRKGYYVSIVAEKVSQIERTEDHEDSSPEEVKKRVEREKPLYAPLVEWLRGQGYRADDTSSSKKLGEWGNPDVTGVMPVVHLQSTIIEIVTIEAKFSLKGWKRWIFEAVSHRRFANRAYFAYARLSETILKVPPEMRYYCELYDVGVLAIGLESDTFLSLGEGKNKSIDLQDTEIEVVHFAPFSYVQPRWQKDFFESIDISDQEDLFMWGKPPLPD